MERLQKLRDLLVVSFHVSYRGGSNIKLEIGSCKSVDANYY